MVKAEAQDQVENQDAINKAKANKAPSKTTPGAVQSNTSLTVQVNEVTGLLNGEINKNSSGSNLKADGNA